ncbi:MAG: hypothetical protein COT55_00620 [Candidatus Diapherotrites archaeon CG09_land_8_20_14_0_10_32_12]|nr:MAG: hypothetical protein COT55_00620 [Candidatus Diapherotrites archaeon CG09_land_8_20_14_0_10_32_12]
MSISVNVNLHIDDYTNRVLGVIKEKNGFKDKSQALMYFAKQYGKDFVDPEIKDDALKKMIAIEDAHMKKYGLRKQTLQKLRAEIESD